MTLTQACAILAKVHTIDDDFTGFKVARGPTVLDGIAPADYFEAWEVVRRAGETESSNANRRRA